jgi:MraZ protein
MVFSNQALYVGEFRHNLDAKGRLTIPSKWRFQGDEMDVYLGLPNPSGFITVYPPDRIRLLEEKIRKISITDGEGQRALTAFLSMAHKFGCDRSGRINLNEKLIAHAGIEKEAVLLGAVSSFNIYSPAVYATLTPQSPADMADLFQKFDL